MSKRSSGSVWQLAKKLEKRHLSARHQRRAVAKMIKEGKLKPDGRV